MPKAEAYGSSFVCLFVIPSFTSVLRRTLKGESKTRHYLAFEYVKVSYEALFSSYGVICLP